MPGKKPQLTAAQKAELHRITAPYIPRWESGDTTDSDWKREIKAYTDRAGIDYATAIAYLQG
jgi:hypothetical protein